MPRLVASWSSVCGSASWSRPIRANAEGLFMAGKWEDLSSRDLGRVITAETPLTGDRKETISVVQIPFCHPIDMDGRKDASATNRTPAS